MATNAVYKVQDNTGTSTLGANNAVAFTNNVTLGNLIVVAIVTTSTTTGSVTNVTDSLGNGYTRIFTDETSGNLGDVELYYAKNILGGANTVTATFSGSISTAMIVREYYGLDPVSPLYQQDGAATGSSTTPTSNTIKSTQAPALLIGVMGQVGVTGTISAGSGYTNLTTISNVNEVAIEDQFVTSTSSYSASFSLTGSLQWQCGIAVFAMSPHGTTTSTSSTSSTSSSTSSTSTSISSISTSSTSSSISSTSISISTSSTSTSLSITTLSTSSTSTSISSTSISSTSSSTSFSSTSSSISSTSTSSTSTSSTSSSTSISSISTSLSSTSSSISSTSSSISSTSTSSTSSSSSTSTTTLPPPYLTYTYQDQNSYTIVQQFTPFSPTTWLCPAGVTSVLAECWGGGGGGGGSSSTAGGGGGAGGGYANATVTVTPGTSYTVTVGSGGGGGNSSGGSGSSGGSSFFNTNTTVKGVGGGFGAGSTGASGAGGSAGTNVGTVTQAGGGGGNGSAALSDSGGGGGGGAGSQSPGTAGGAGTGSAGAGGAGGGGAYGGAGASGGSSAAGSTPTTILGGGGGGGGGLNFAGGNGAPGLVQLTYTVNTNPQSNSTDLAGSFNAVNYSNVSTDEGDYFIQNGSKYMVQEFKKKWTNNVDIPAFAIKTRSTSDTRLSPILVQIYNQNLTTWETLATINSVPADVEFNVNVSQTVNVSNYYDSNNIIAFRIYQRVI